MKTPLTPTQRKALLKRLAENDLDKITFEAVTFRSGPNRNGLRINDADLPRFAASFAGVPFLRDHEAQQIDARAGIVLSSEMQGGDMLQRIEITNPRDIAAYLNGQIDRFSIAWFHDGAICSLCGAPALECEHQPARSYAQKGAKPKRAELIFINPSGKEVSAVNAPAIDGTHITAQLRAQLSNSQERFFIMPPEEVTTQPADTWIEATRSTAISTMLAAANLPPVLHAQLQAQLDNMPNASVQQVTEIVAAASAANARQSEANAWAGTLRSQAIDGMIAAAKLTPASTAAVRAALSAIDAPSTTQVSTIIEAQRTAEAALQENNVIRGIGPRISGMRTAEDDIQGALNWMFGDAKTAMPAPHLRSLRDLYLTVTGDVEFAGRFTPEYARLTSANTGTLTGMAVNALNKVVMMHFDNMATFRWYEPIVQVLPHDGSTNTIQLIHMDGVAALPTVVEGGAYPEALTGDSKETATFTKYGSYVGITLEMIRRSDIARVQAIPRILVQAAIRRRSATIAAIFTTASGTGPTMADDSTVLFHSNHGNVSTTAFDATEWAAQRKKIYSQTVPGTSMKLGIWPTYVLLPIDLYDTALTAFGYGTGDVGKPSAAGTAQTVNPYGESRAGDPRPIPIVVPDWTDTNDWASIVDPRLHPVIVMAYAGNAAGGAHAMPEIYEVRSETTGLMFSNDTLPIKIRDWWASGVTTHVGVAKSNVT